MENMINRPLLLLLIRLLLTGTANGQERPKVTYAGGPAADALLDVVLEMFRSHKAVLSWTLFVLISQ